MSSPAKLALCHQIVPWLQIMGFGTATKKADARRKAAANALAALRQQQEY
jgi:hypothetical protein